MDLENLIKTIKEMLEENGAENIEQYELLSNVKGVEVLIENKKFDIRITER